MNVMANALSTIQWNWGCMFTIKNPNKAGEKERERETSAKINYIIHAKIC